MTLISKLIKDKPRALQKLRHYFNDTIILIFFVPPSAVLRVIFYLKKALLSLAAGKLAIASLSSKIGSSL